MGRAPGTIKEVDATTAKRWMDSGEAVIVDVRRERIRARCYIPGTVSLPLDRLDRESMPGEAGDRLVFQCDVGVTSLAVARRVAIMGVDRRIFNLSGGIRAWSAAGLPTLGTGSFLHSLFSNRKR